VVESVVDEVKKLANKLRNLKWTGTHRLRSHLPLFRVQVSSAHGSQTYLVTLQAGDGLRPAGLTASDVHLPPDGSLLPCFHTAVCRCDMRFTFGYAARGAQYARGG
jgi:hypothetical protein